MQHPFAPVARNWTWTEQVWTGTAPSWDSRASQHPSTAHRRTGGLHANSVSSLEMIQRTQSQGRTFGLPWPPDTPLPERSSQSPHPEDIRTQNRILKEALAAERKSRLPEGEKDNAMALVEADLTRWMHDVQSQGLPTSITLSLPDSQGRLPMRTSYSTGFRANGSQSLVYSQEHSQTGGTVDPQYQSQPPYGPTAQYGSAASSTSTDEVRTRLSLSRLI